jgi:hypothetical protein
MCEECNYIWEAPQRYVGDPEVTHCPQCDSAEIEETKPQNFPKADVYLLLDEVRAKTIVVENEGDCIRIQDLEIILSEHFS